MVNDLEQKLALIKNVKRFCVEELGIARNNSYTKINNKDDSVKYNLYFSPKETIETGCYVSDKGFTPLDILKSIGLGWDYENDACIQYYSIDKCFAAEYLFKKLKHDTFIREIPAFVKRSFKSCDTVTQINDALLRIEEVRIAEIIAHENMHIHLIKNRCNTNLYIEECVAEEFAQHTIDIYFKDDPEVIKKATEHRKHLDEFFDWYEDSRKALKKAYSQSYTKGRRALSQIRKEYHFKINWDIPGAFHFENKNINNAFFLSVTYYSKYKNAVHKILKDENPVEYLKKISSAKELYTLKQLKEIVHLR